MADEYGFKPPAAMNFTGNVAENWKLFKQKLGFYLEATGKSSKTAKIKIAILMSCIGEQGIRIYNTFSYETGEDANVYETVLGKFDAYCNPKKNLIFERYVFNTIDQKEGESADMFITRLNNQAQKCEYGALEIELVRDRIVVGCVDPKVRKRLLVEDNLTYKKAVDIIQTSEIVVSQTRMMGSEPEAPQAVNKINKVTGDGNCDILNCIFCGGEHDRGACPAYNLECRKCGDRGHYAKKCDELKQRQKEKKSHERGQSYEKNNGEKSYRNAGGKNVHGINMDAFVNFEDLSSLNIE